MEILQWRTNEAQKVNAGTWRRQPTTIEESGIDFSQIVDLCLKTLRFGGRLSGREVAIRMAVHYSVIEGTLAFLKREKMVEIVGSQGIVEQMHEYTLSDKGYEKASEAFDRNQYVGPAPVSLREYVEVVKSQSIRKAAVTPGAVNQALSDLELNPAVRRLIGAAVNGGQSILLHGKPGNGKTSVAKRIVDMIGGSVLIPHAVDVGGQTIRVFDPRVHSLAGPDPGAPDPAGSGELEFQPQRRDERWVIAKRPLITVGGELTLDDLDLRYSPQTKFYLAPVQILANCGILVVDDFGRQKMRPDELLNRWIVPMEESIDHYSLVSGETIEIPFELLLVFSTNLDPNKLGDEAFWRRIRHKVEISDPDESTFVAILKAVCENNSIVYQPQGARYLIDTHYRPTRREFRACHPRDLIGLCMDMGGYEGVQPELTPEWLDAACAAYFMTDEAKAA